MPIGNSYPVDNNIGDKDLLIGTRSSNLSTVNYAAETVAKYLNQQGKISIGGQLTFKFVDVNPISGTISLPGGGGDNTPFSDITNLIVSIFDVSFQNVVNYLTYIVGSEILLNQQKETSIFGNYKILSYTVTANPNLYDLEVQYLGGPGNIAVNNFYDLSFFRAEPAPTDLTLSTVGTTGPATLIGNLLNIPNYSTDLSGYVQTSITINTTSPLQGGGDLSANRTLSILQANITQDGYLSSTDWNTFNSKYTLPSLTSGSVLFSNGTTIAEDNSNFFWNDTNNRLGIGTNTPTHKLDVLGAIGSGRDVIKFKSEFSRTGYLSTTDTFVALSTAPNTTGATILLTDTSVHSLASSFIQFSTNGSERARFVPSGNLLVGTATDSGGRLTVRAQGALSGIVLML